MTDSEKIGRADKNLKYCTYCALFCSKITPLACFHPLFKRFFIATLFSIPKTEGAREHFEFRDEIKGIGKNTGANEFTQVTPLCRG